jgi:hypothetical protein
MCRRRKEGFLAGRYLLLVVIYMTRGQILIHKFLSHRELQRITKRYIYESKIIFVFPGGAWSQSLVVSGSFLDEWTE